MNLMPEKYVTKTASGYEIHAQKSLGVKYLSHAQIRAELPNMTQDQRSALSIGGADGKVLAEIGFALTSAEESFIGELTATSGALAGVKRKHREKVASEAMKAMKALPKEKRPSTAFEEAEFVYNFSRK